MPSYHASALLVTVLIYDATRRFLTDAPDICTRWIGQYQKPPDFIVSGGDKL